MQSAKKIFRQIKITIVALTLCLAVGQLFISTALAAPVVAATNSTVYNSLPVALSDSGNYNFTALMYHHLAPEGTYPENTNGAILSCEKFEEQMKWLYDNNFTTLLASEVASYVQNGLPLPQKSVMITFDDGYESNYVYAFPILQKYQIKANIAVVVKSSLELEGKEATPYQDNVLSHLTFAQMREMADSGLVEIGSHSYDGHKYVIGENKDDSFFVTKQYLMGWDRYETQEEYRERITHDLMLSRNILERELHRSVRYFAYPYGKSNQDVLTAAQAAGFNISVTVRAGINDTRTGNVVLLNRYNIGPTETLEDFSKKVLLDLSN